MGIVFCICWCHYTCRFFYVIENRQRKKSDRLIEKANKTLEKVEPIIQKQGEIIEEQEKERKIHHENTIDSVRFYFKSARNTMVAIDKGRLDCVTPEIFKNTYSYFLDSLNTYQSQIMKIVSEEHKWLDEETMSKIDFARAGIAVYVKRMKELDNTSIVGLEAATDPVGVMKRIDEILAWLPDPRPMA